MMALDQIGAQANLQGWLLVCALAGTGLFVGVLTGLFGVGGGFLAVPMLSALLGIPYPLAVGSSLSFVIGTSAAGLARHRRMGNVETRSILHIAGGAIVGAILGDLLQQFLITTVARGDQRAFTLIMDCLFVALLLGTGWLAYRGPKLHVSGRSILQRLPLGPRVDLPAAGLRGLSLPGLCLIGLAIGVLTGLLGVGGGVLLMPALMLWVGLAAHQAVGTSLGVVLLASIAGTIKKGLDNEVSLWIVMSLLVGSAVGVQIGAALCQHLHAHWLRRYFAAIVLLAALLLAVNVAGRLTDL